MFRAEFPAADPDPVPNSTGGEAVSAPDSGVESFPAAEDQGPTVVIIENPHTIETVFIPEDRIRHILDGEGRSGGHRFGTGIPGKTEFPASWSDDDILEAIRYVAGTGVVIGPAHRKNDLLISGEVNGVTIRVVVRADGQVRTGYPISGEGVVRNPR